MATITEVIEYLSIALSQTLINRNDRWQSEFSLKTKKQGEKEGCWIHFEQYLWV